MDTFQVNTEKYVAKELLRGLHISGLDVDKNFTEKDEEQKKIEKHWFSRIEWWASLKRVGFAPSFSSNQQAKRRKV